MSESMGRIRTLSPEPVFMLVLMNGQPTSKEARARIAGASELRGVAMVLSSTVGTMLTNFFLRVNRPGFPMRVFHDEAEAKAWLLETIEKSSS